MTSRGVHSVSEYRGQELVGQKEWPLRGLEGGYWEKGVPSWAREVRGPFLHLTARTPVFSSVRTKMTMAWQGRKGQRDTLCSVCPQGTGPYPHVYWEGPCYTRPSWEEGWAPGDLWDKPQLLLSWPWYSHAACPAARALLSTQDPGPAFKVGTWKGICPGKNRGPYAEVSGPQAGGHLWC